MKKTTLFNIFFNGFTLVASLSLLGIFALWIWFSNSDLNALLENQEENPQVPSDPPAGVAIELAPIPTLVTLLRPEANGSDNQNTISASNTQPTPTPEILRSISAPTPSTIEQNSAPVVEQVVIGEPPPAPSGGGGNSKSHSSSKSS